MFEYLECDTVSKATLPQMDEVLGSGKGYNPVHELMRAMILRAIEDYNSGGELREDALKYFFADDNSDGENDDDDYILSFSFICRHLGIDPFKTRCAIMNATHRISTRRRAA